MKHVSGQVSAASGAELKALIGENMRRIWAENPELVGRLSSSMKQFWNSNPDALALKNRLSVAMKQAMGSPELKSSIKSAMNKAWVTGSIDSIVERVVSSPHLLLECLQPVVQ